MKLVLAAITVFAIPGVGCADTLTPRIESSELPAFKRTPEERYFSSRDVFRLVWAEPSILFIDVRDPVEVALSGHPEKIDAVVPVQILGLDETGDPRDAELVDNPAFRNKMTKVLLANNKSRHDLIIVTCGSGRRSAMATRILSENGYTNVWHVPDGYDGDDVVGYNRRNAWKDAGLPWSMDLVEATEWALKMFD